MVEARSFAEIAELTGLPRETVRRYLLGGEPSVEFIIALCTRLGVRAHWLLTGDGPVRQESTIPYYLAHAHPRALLESLARHIDAAINNRPRAAAGDPA